MASLTSSLSRGKKLCHLLHYMSALYHSLVWLPWLVDVWREMAAVFGHPNTPASTFPVLSGSVVLPQPSLPFCFWRKLRMSINFLQAFFWPKSICNLLFFFVSLVFQLGEGQVRQYNSGRSADQWRTGEGRIGRMGAGKYKQDIPIFVELCLFCVLKSHF